MEKRINIDETEPQAYKAMYALEGYLANSQLSKSHKELIKIRASQINGCAFCIDMHTKDAIKYGETPQRIFLLSAWREATIFSEEEKVILALTEEITLIHHRGLSEETYQKALQLFGKNYLAQMIMAVATINAWNRIAVSTHLEIPA
ncbi:carboxymuconolactone decarboxylase family protein [Flavobacterium amniphilum]|uniref:carboxymuconolactone decarboxylase family protein n=1 Tax=Flavobacterium amniphilum TaxID=1834035 RepID=UPI00202A2CF7|nr:carboxymuconolactone decarboxylase family protein [Flavobacterium amniphilum]MCL9807649.1 carboxymuconolactone decarboxylase family protein [Flavobacterium amniphilum]